MQEKKKTQLQGFARKGNGTRVVANGVHANRTVRKTKNTIMMEYSGGVHLVNKLQKERSMQCLTEKCLHGQNSVFDPLENIMIVFLLSTNEIYLLRKLYVSFGRSSHILQLFT